MCQGFLPENRSRRSWPRVTKKPPLANETTPFCSCWRVWACEPAKWLPSRWTTSIGKPALVTVRGKGKRVAQMPLPSEVGTAIADYLSTGRPRCSSRRVFIRAKAPLTGFANSVAICSLVDRALERAGVESEYRGSHVFRHSLATGMLNHGASLDEIGDLLRHRRPDTTRIYAKVDLVSLRSIALPWPGGSR